jgi:hypothetical protein
MNINHDRFAGILRAGKCDRGVILPCGAAIAGAVKATARKAKKVLIARTNISGVLSGRMTMGLQVPVAGMLPFLSAGWRQRLQLRRRIGDPERAALNLTQVARSNLGCRIVKS